MQGEQTKTGSLSVLRLLQDPIIASRFNSKNSKSVKKSKMNKESKVEKLFKLNDKSRKIKKGKSKKGKTKKVKEISEADKQNALIAQNKVAKALRAITLSREGPSSSSMLNQSFVNNYPQNYHQKMITARNDVNLKYDNSRYINIDQDDLEIKRNQKIAELKKN